MKTPTVIYDEPVDMTEFYADNQVSCTEGPPRSTDLENVPYTSLVAGGIKPEGKNYSCYYTSKQGAIEAYYTTLLSFLKDNTHITWREEPSLQGVIFAESPRTDTIELWQVFSRLTVQSQEKLIGPNKDRICNCGVPPQWHSPSEHR